jgi:hypothetical protein
VNAEAAFLHGTLGQTWFVRSLLPTTSLGRDSRVTKM